MGFNEGDTAIVAPLPRAEAAIGRLRRRHDAAAAAGMPAHVTILDAWIRRDRLTGEDIEGLAAIAATEPAFAVRFGACGRFAKTLWLAPEPAEPFLRLISAAAAAWPEHPPYGGAHADVVPHCTVGESADASLLARLASETERLLPLSERIDELAIVTFRAGRWQRFGTCPLGRPAQAAR